MKIYRTMAIVAVCILGLFSSAFADIIDAEPIESVPQHKHERAFTFSLTTTGLGLGGSYRFNMPWYAHYGINLEFFMVSDDKEVEIYDPFYNTFFKLNDNNRMFLTTGNMELKKRLFANDIEDNFRPHVMVQLGGAYGMNFPREEVFLVNGIERVEVQRDNEYRFTGNFVMGLGVDVSTRPNYFFSIRPQYRLTFFNEEIAGKTNHSAFEIKFEIGGQF